MSTENATQQPVIVAGTSFPRLEMADLIAWASEVKTGRRVAVENRVKADASLSPFEKQRLIQIADEAEIELGQLLIRSFTPVGIQKVLVTSLGKTGKPAAEIKSILAGIHFREQAALAERIMSAPDPIKEESPPLTEEAPATEETGALSEP